MTKQTAFLLLHLAALVLACTAFTVVTAPLGGHGFRWNYFSYAYANGWGYTYQSDYSLAEVLAYLTAFALGVVCYALPTRPVFLARFAMLLCVVGFVSFAVELSHWFFDHHLCLIFSLPLVLLMIGLWTLIATHVRKPVAGECTP